MFWKKKKTEGKTPSEIVNNRLGNLEKHMSEVLTSAYKGKTAKYVDNGQIYSFKIKKAYIWPDGLYVVGGDYFMGWEHRSKINDCEIK